MPISAPPERLNISTPIAAHCRAVITIPAKNEAATLTRCLDAFISQTGCDGAPVSSNSFEVLLLLNNCRDNSAEVARTWQAANPSFALHIAERVLTGRRAHVGTARKLLMDAACERLDAQKFAPQAILSTDADTVVAPDWIARNLHTLAQGADVVGGEIFLLPEELERLSPDLRRSYQQDRRYASLVSQLEDRLDPRPGDPWPRHVDHFGSSLACTPEAYRRAGGMPAVSPLEDEAFVDCVRRADLTLRHEPAVKVFTSARLRGRVRIGLARQLQCWSKLASADAHQVLSADFLDYRFRLLRQLRAIYTSRNTDGLALPTPWWKETVANALQDSPSCPAFLGAIYCDILIEESFERDRKAKRREPIAQAIAGLEQRLHESSTCSTALHGLRRPLQAGSVLSNQ